MSTAAVSKSAPATPAKPSEPVKTNPTAATAAPATVSGADKAAKARKGRKLVPENETPAQTFKRLTEPRVVKALKCIKQLQNLSRFKPEDAHREKVFTAIRAALVVAEQSWKGATPASEGFSL